jgi:peptidyl-prolyl isomerase D
LNDKPAFDDEDPEDLRVKYSALKISSFLNRAMCSLKLGENADCIKVTGMVLEQDEKYLKKTDKTKAYFRRGLAKLNGKDEEGAIEDFQAAHELDAADPLVLKELNNAKAKLAAKKQKQKNAFAKMFA